MSKDKLTAGEWELVRNAPFWVNQALSTANNGLAFFAKRREAKALEKAMKEYKTSNALIKDIVADDSDPAKEIGKASLEASEQALSRIASVVRNKLGNDDADALAVFLLNAGRAAALASREGGTAAGNSVSDEEEAVLKKIEKAIKAASASAQAQPAPKPAASSAKPAPAPAKRDDEAQAAQLESAPQPAAPASQFTQFIAEHTVVPGDNLSFISQKYYGTQANFRILYEANKDVIGENMNLIRPGQVLKIPKL
jgi:nucleoid-associated protein YgaU